jgi:Tol biopolymer transport system component
VLGLLIVAAIAATTWLFQRQAAPPPRITRLTSFNGMEITPALSPDGRLVAFGWNGPAEDNYDIYVQLIGSVTPLRLTTDPARDLSPAWAPDGRFIAFVRLNADLTLTVHKVSALGGPEQRLGTVRRPANTFPLRLSWTPDGRWIVAGSYIDDWTSALFLIPAHGGGMRQMTSPPAGLSDMSGTVSPNGRKLAFLRATGGVNWRVHVAELGPEYCVSGEARPIGPTIYSMLAPMWSPDSRDLYYVSEHQGVLAMNAFSSLGGGHRLISAGWPAGWVEASLLPDQNRAVLSDGWNDLDLWRFDLTGRKPPARIASSTASDINPQYSPDGLRLAFSSRRSGWFQIWLADVDGSNQRQLTNLPSILTGMPRWSPDGKKLAFDARVEGQERIWVVDAEGGEPRCLTPAINALNPSWSRDGNSVYFSSRQTGRAEIWRVRLASGTPAGNPIQITTTEGWNAFESHDARFLYYVQKYQNGPILRIPVGGGEPETIVPRINVLHNIVVAEEGIYYGFAETAQSNQSVWFYAFATGKSTELLNTGRRSGIGLTVGPGGRTLICTLTETRGGDLWLVEGFRK